MSVAAWTNASRSLAYNQKPEVQRAIPTLQSHPKGEQTASEAASATATVYDPLIQAMDGLRAHGHVAQIWTISRDGSLKPS